MENITVLFFWDVPKPLVNYLKDGLSNIVGLELIFPDPPEYNEYLKLIPQAHVLVGWRPSRELLDAGKNLKLFINPGAGIFHLIEMFRDINTSRKLIMCNGHGNSYFTAQHAVALLMALTNKVIPHHNWMQNGKWRRGEDYGRSTPIRGRNIGLFGYGAINQKVHRFLSGFDVSFSILRNSWDEKNGELVTDANKFHPNELHDFLKQVDVLFIAVPHTKETEGIINERELELLGPDGFLVNVARGNVVSEIGLYKALKNEVIKGAAIDVWYNYQPEENEKGEKYPTSQAFHELDNVVLSPHRGASPMNDLKRWDEVVENITRFANDREDFLNIVDLDREY
ncbi:MAG: NAD(P)-dependent oxidoreductase [Candidatus Kariarchaeaceae archaeon]